MTIIGVVNYRTPLDLDVFLASALDQRDVDFVVVTHNEPTDACMDVTHRWERSPAGKRLFVIWNSTNRGYAHAANVMANGYVHLDSGSDIFALFNADTEFKTQNDVADMVHFMLDNKLAIAGPKQVNRKGQITHAGIFGTNEKPRLRGWKERDKGQYDDQRFDCVSVSGSAYFLSMTMFDALANCPLWREWLSSECPSAMWDHRAFLPTQHYYEETWLSYHAREHGYRIGYNGEVEMIHEWHQASPVGGEADRVWVKESREMFRSACDHHGIEHD